MLSEAKHLRMEGEFTIDLRGFENACNAAFLPYFHNTARFLVLYGGAGSGKSVFAAQKLLVRLLCETGHKFLVARKVAATLRNSCFALLRELIFAWNLGEFFAFNKTSLEIVCKANGNSIIFSGLDDVEKLKSISGVSGIWVEEASELHESDLHQLNLRLRGQMPNYKQIILSFNPISETHWLKAMFFDKSPENAALLHSTYKDNAFLDKEYIAELLSLKERNVQFYNIYALGLWGVASEGLIYPHYEIIDKLPTENVRKHIYGVDFGFNDPTAIVECVLTDTELCVREIAYITHKTTGEIIAFCNREAPHLRKLTGYFESAEPDRIREFQLAGYRVVGAKKSILDGINAVKMFALKVCADSPNIIKELGRYTWAKDREGRDVDVPIDLYNHAMDAIRYAVFSCGKPRAPFSFWEQSEGQVW